MVALDKRPAETPTNTCLADYRDTVERLRDETIIELGRQPMAPETASMLAVLAASLPIVAALHPANPVTLEVWQVGTILACVWIAVFRLQSSRYERFHAAWSRKVAAHRDGELVTAPVRAFRYPKSGQTTGACAAEKRLVSVASPSAMARTSSSRPASTTSPWIDRPSSSQTSREPSTQRQGASR